MYLPSRVFFFTMQQDANRDSPSNTGDEWMYSQRILMMLLGWIWLLGASVAAAQPNPTDPNCSAANLMLVVDVSGSMTEGGKLDGLKKAISDTVKQFKTQLRMGLISFSGSSAELLVQVGPDNIKDAQAVAAHIQKLEQAVQNLKALGSTPMTAAMKLAKSNYESVLPTDSLHLDPDPKTQRRCFVLLATDGEPTDGDPLPFIKDLRKLVVGAKTYDVRTFVVGLGSQDLIRPFQLKQFAIAGGTDDFFHALTPEDLKPFFDNISKQASKEICDGRDNDCDGVIDQGLERECKNDCGTGKEICHKGVWGPCDAPQPKPEICNGRDENCNGQVDEGLTRPCESACGKGTQTCIQGDWSTCNAPRPETEICDGIDNDCDGQIDNGNLCTGGKCVPQGQGRAVCEIPCNNNECPAGYTCNTATKLCVAGPCANHKCAPGEICSEKTGKAVCENLCAGVQCPAGQTCGLSGTCVDCYQNPCPPQMLCVQGRCVVDACKQQACDKSQACILNKQAGTAACADTCVSLKCGAGEVCTKGRCELDVCAKLNCPSGQYCNKNLNRCEENLCVKNNVTCGSADKFTCDPKSGACEDSPCVGVQCPQGSYCWLGECYADTSPKTWPKGQCGQPTDCGAPGMTCKNGFCVASGTTDPQGKACGCQSNPTSPWFSLFFVLLWIGLLVSRRFRTSS